MTLLDSAGRPLSAPQIDTRPEQDARHYQHLMVQTAIDLRRTHFVHVMGPITVYGTWLLTLPERPGCLVLLPSQSHRQKAFGRRERPQPFVIPEFSGWIWCEPPTGDEIKAATMACDAALTLGLNPGNKRDIFRVLSTVREHIPDLYLIPPCPARDSVVAGDIILDTDKGRFETEFRHDL